MIKSIQSRDTMIIQYMQVNKQDIPHINQMTEKNHIII
jgi:hypothetical protein